jgi:phosphoribosyl 1,2-cyclic phosphodiesterase
VRFASLGSGSRGNALVVEAGRTRVLVDCGFGPRSLAARLERLGLEAAGIDAILVTHEHSDHLSGVAPCARRHGLEVYLTHGTMSAARFEGVSVRVIDSHAPFAIGDLEIRPFPVPHDAREPAQFAFSDGSACLGVLTDAGRVTPHMVAMLACCDALVLECNHDVDMLAGGRYPAHLKRRIAGPYGHLDNAAAAELLAQVDTGRIKHVIAAHLSQENNLPDLARAALARVLGCEPAWIGLADQDNGCDWRQLY